MHDVFTVTNLLMSVYYHTVDSPGLVTNLMSVSHHAVGTPWLVTQCPPHSSHSRSFSDRFGKMKFTFVLYKHTECLSFCDTQTHAGCVCATVFVSIQMSCELALGPISWLHRTLGWSGKTRMSPDDTSSIRGAKQQNKEQLNQTTNSISTYRTQTKSKNQCGQTTASLLLRTEEQRKGDGQSLEYCT